MDVKLIERNNMLMSSSQRFLAIPSARLKSYGDRAFEVVAPKLWNALPLDLRLNLQFHRYFQKPFEKLPFQIGF